MKKQKILYSNEIISFFQLKGFNFKTIPDFGNYILDLNTRTEGRYNLVRSLDLNKIHTPEEYLKEYSKNLNTIRLYENVLEQIYNAAIFWGIECEPSYFTPEEIVIIILARLYTIHCCVLYKKDIAPNSKTEYDRTVISHINGYFTKLSFWK